MRSNMATTSWNKKMKDDVIIICEEPWMGQRIVPQAYNKYNSDITYCIISLTNTIIHITR